MKKFWFTGISRFVLSIIIFTGCSKSPEAEYAGTFLAQVGPRIITVEDFQRRAEFTIRPGYCAGSNNIHKKIILNSLIAEKLLALEEQGHSDLDANQPFQLYITGQKEQAMRKWLYHDWAVKKVELTEEEVHAIAQRAIRSYTIQYFTTTDQQFIEQVIARLDQDDSLQSIYREIRGQEKLPSKKVSWFDNEEPPVHQALFSRDLVVGEILQPIQTLGGQTLFIEVIDIEDQVLMTEQGIKLHLSDVREKMVSRRAAAIHEKKSAQLMQGQEFLLNQPVFLPYAQTMANNYFLAAQKGKEFLDRSVWDIEMLKSDSDPGSGVTIGGQEVLFSLNGEPWTVKYFEQVLLRHPLVFRNRDMAYNEFPEQLKYAIADLILDLALTKEAYSLGYDKSPSVKQYTALWEDHIRGTKYRSNYLRDRISISEPDTLDQDILLSQYLQPLIDSLQQKYSNKIQIDMEQFQRIELTQISAIAMQSNVPFPMLVPSFPVYTSEHRIDYGKLVSK